jgi:beta-glucanase (GH16 family)
VLKSAVLAICVLLAVDASLGVYGGKVRADNLAPCSLPQPSPAPRAVVDDFSGPAGSPPNPQLWNHKLGGGGTDGELEAVTNSPRNASLDGNGNLAIVAFNEPFQFPGLPDTFDYTSAFLDTHGHLDFCYGIVAARIKLPTGQGLRPAFWLVGSDFDTVGWPDCGEVDIIELPIGAATLHGPGGYELPFWVPFDVGTDWHEYALDWRRDKISASIDGRVFAYWTPASLPPNATWVFNDHPMYVILSMPIGGPFGLPDSSTPFPATMLVDWVRYTPAM